MKRESVLKLGEAIWVKPFENDELEVSIVPSKLADLCQSFQDDWGPWLIERVVRDGFVEFRGYENGDGKPVPNTIEARRELLNIGMVRAAIKARVYEVNAGLVKGESVAASG